MCLRTSPKKVTHRTPPPLEPAGSLLFGERVCWIEPFQHWIQREKGQFAAFLESQYGFWHCALTIRLPTSRFAFHWQVNRLDPAIAGLETATNALREAL